MEAKGFSFEVCKEAAEFILSKIGFVPETGIILGTGCHPFADRIENRISIPYASIPHFLKTTNSSHVGELVCGTVGGRKIICMNGRFHFYEGYSPEELALPVNVLKLVGIKRLIVTNASGAVNPSYRPGDLMIISDHIKLFFGSPMRGVNQSQLGPRFFDVTDMYTEKLREIARECAKSTSLRVHEGVYMFFPGPQFETPAEIRAARILGADVVGMSTVTEALTAAHCKLPLLGIAVITNMASGVEKGPMDGSEVDGVASGISKQFCDYLEDIVCRF